jgi:hypothetical protein
MQSVIVINAIRHSSYAIRHNKNKLINAISHSSYAISHNKLCN